MSLFAWSKSLKNIHVVDKSFVFSKKTPQHISLHTQPRLHASQIQDGGNMILEYLYNPTVSLFKSVDVFIERPHKSRSLESAEKPLKLVLKVGGGKETIVSKEKKSHHGSKSSGSFDKPKNKDHSKKKKKKRSASKERKKHKLDPGSSVCSFLIWAYLH